jgi:hypothetical protein
MAGILVPSETANWTTFTPTFGNFTVGNATISAKYLKINKTLTFRIVLTWGSTTSISSESYLNFPIAAASDAAAQGGIYSITYQDTGSTTYNGMIQSVGTSSSTIRFGNAKGDGTYVYYGNHSSTIPFSWTTSDIIYFGGMYEVA